MSFLPAVVAIKPGMTRVDSTFRDPARQAELSTGNIVVVSLLALSVVLPFFIAAIVPFVYRAREASWPYALLRTAGFTFAAGCLAFFMITMTSDSFA